MDIVIEPAELRDTAKRLLEKTVNRRAAYDDAANDRGAALRELMAEQGWMLLTTPAEQDGLGQSFLALAPIYEELGRTLAPAAYAGTMATVDVLATLGADGAEWLGRIGAGEAIFAVAQANGIVFDGDKATGTLTDVWEGVQATHLLLLPGQADGPLAIVDLSVAGAAVSDIELWDRSRTAAEVTLSGAEAVILLSGAEARGAAAVARAHLDLAIACDSLGAADSCLEEAIAYMGTRQQFNRPIGSFQALKHRSADLKVGLEIARALTNDACAAYAQRREDWVIATAKAKLLAAGAFRSLAEESVQFHGGIGFTWEHDCHLFLKRALLNEMLGGSPEQYKDRLAPEVFARAVAAKGGTN